MNKANDNNLENSVISSAITQFFILKPNNYKNPNQTHEKTIKQTKNLCFIKENYSLNWENINEAFEWGNLDSEIFEELIFSHEKCVEKIPVLHSILQEICNLKERKKFSSKNLFNSVKGFCAWTNRLEDLENLFNLQENFESKTLLNILLLSSILEYSLGNVFFSKNNQKPPFLLKILLQSEELQEIFGNSMRIVRYLLGSPVSVNLRNLAWHGFPTQDLINETFSDLLLLIISSFGLILNESQVKILLRPLNFVSVKKVKEMPLIFSKNLNFDICIKAIESSNTILDCHKNIWKDLTRLSFTYEEPGFATILLLPQFEMMLRNIYGKINSWDTTAKIDEYYIILDNVLNDQIIGNPEQKNNFKELLDDSSLSLFYDLFNALDGPRIRDRTSHGEVELKDLDKKIFQTLLILSLHISEKFSTKSNGPSNLNRNYFEFSYESIFHPVSQLKFKLQELKLLLEKLEKIKLPCLELEIDKNDQPKIIQSIPEIYPILYIRHGCEAESVSYLLKILENSSEAVKNFDHALIVRSGEYVARKLGSSRRKTFEKTVENFWKIFSGMALLFNMCIKIIELGWINDKNLLQEIKVQRAKVLRKALKIAENYSKCLDIQNNDWLSACNDVKSLEIIFCSIK